MGIIINPRGPSGSGKTRLARRIMADYGWNNGSAEPLSRYGREQPIGYLLPHPLGARPLIVVGHYERTSGGCDTITAIDGGLDEVFRIASTWAASGADVILEGSALSAEYVRSATLARSHRMHVLLLSTSIEQSARNLTARRRTRRSDWPSLTPALLAQRTAVEEACRRLKGTAEVEELAYQQAHRRARDLLGLRSPELARRHLPPTASTCSLR